MIVTSEILSYTIVTSESLKKELKERMIRSLSINREDLQNDEKKNTMKQKCGARARSLAACDLENGGNLHRNIPLDGHGEFSKLTLIKNRKKHPTICLVVITGARFDRRIQFRLCQRNLFFTRG